MFRECRPHAHLALHPPAIASNGHSLEEIWEILGEYRLRILRAAPAGPASTSGTPGHAARRIPLWKWEEADRADFMQRTEVFDVMLAPLP